MCTAAVSRESWLYLPVWPLLLYAPRPGFEPFQKPKNTVYWRPYDTNHCIESKEEHQATPIQVSKASREEAGNA